MIRSRSSLLLAGAAVVLAVAGFLLILGGGGDDGGSSSPAGGSVGGPTGERPSPAATPTGNRPSDDPGQEPAPADTTAGHPQATPSSSTEDEPLEPSDTPTLPPGMRQPEPVTVPDPATVDGGDPAAVAVAALTAAYSFDTARDTSPADAMNRAQVWLAEPYDSSAYDLDGLRQDVERDWERWSQHRAFASISGIDPHTTDVDTPDTATRAERRFYVRMTPIGRDAWNGPLVEHQWFAFLERASVDDQWRVVELQTPLAHR